jgi:hypothetical protein
MRRLLVVACLLAAVGCKHHGNGQGPGSVEGTPVQIDQSALTAINEFRTETGQVALLDNVALDTAAIRHAGYLALRANGYSHFETVDGTAGGVPDTTNVLFTAVDPASRVRSANGGPDILSGATYDEGSCSIPGAAAIHWLWYSVYHRLPLMRADTVYVGFGDQDSAKGAFPTAFVPAGSGYATMVTASDPTKTAVASSWPPNGTTAVDRWYNPLTETPNPLSSTNGGQNPAMPDVTTRVGPPLHVILPTSQDWATITITLQVQGSGVNEALYILCGGASAVAGASTDVQLRQGEIVFMDQAELQPNTTYAVTVVATTVGATPDSVTLGAGGTWIFTTGL